MRQSKLNIPYRLNADGASQTPSTADGSKPWYGYIGDWLNGVGTIVGSTKEPAPINYYSYGSTSSSGSWIWILAAVAVIVLILFMKK